MAYVCEINPQHRIFLDNTGEQTIVVCQMGQPGQQQQSSSSFTTGAWTQPPALLQSPQGNFIQIQATQGNTLIQLHGTSCQAIATQSIAQPHQTIAMQQTAAMPQPSAMPSIQPMPPMPPMSMGNMAMGNMRMSPTPMQMQMGNMQLSMGHTETTETKDTSSGVSAQHNFCSKCGTAIKPEDNFCSSCGHKLN